jgi:uncharacterized protein YndB with AHSA1/START domain
MLQPEDWSVADLEVSRLLAAPCEAVWRAWSEPELLEQWWAPAPLGTRVIELDLRPGGAFRTLMVMPGGAEVPSTTGIFVQVVPGHRIVFTDALAPDWRPSADPFFTAVISMEDRDGSTLYTARALHKDIGARQRHAELGFEAGWTRSMEQLEEVAAALT